MFNELKHYIHVRCTPLYLIIGSIVYLSLGMILIFSLPYDETFETCLLLLQAMYLLFLFIILVFVSSGVLHNHKKK